MPRIQLPLGFEGTEHLPQTRRDLQNCFNNGNNRIIQRPGIEAISTTGGVARGEFVWNDALYQVVSQQLIKITNVVTGAFSVIGTIADSAAIKTAVGFNNAVIIVPGFNSYTLDSADTLVDVTGNANFEAWADLTHINGRFIYVPFDGSPTKFSDVGAAGTIQALSFFDAEELPDKNNGCFATSANVLAITGTDSIEFFRDNGTTTSAPNPFIRVSGARINNGLIGGLMEYNETFLFVGREKDQDFGIYAIGQGKAPKISNEAIDLVLTTYTQEELAEVLPGRFKWRGYDIATFTFRRDSFGFYAGNWFKLDTVFNGISRPWGAGFLVQFEGVYYTAFDDKIGKLADINTDYGERITRIIETVMEEQDDDYLGAQKIALGLSQGFNAADGSVALQITKNGIQYSNPVYRNTGKIGQYGKNMVWNYPGGTGRYEGFLGFRFYTTEDIDFSTSYLSVS